MRKSYRHHGLILTACCLSACFRLGAQAADFASPPPSAVRWRLLSDNAHYRGPAKSTGATYRWESPATNPGDKSGRRLLDGDRPNNWNTTTGWNRHDNAVVFDFQQPYRFTRAEFHFHKAIPAYVEIQIPNPPDATQPDDWTPVARIDAPANGWNVVSIPEAPHARHLRVFVKLKEWGVYFREVRFFGLPPDEVSPTPPSQLLDTTGPMVLVRNGAPGVSIVVDRPENPEVLHAAWILRDIVEKMSGAALPIFAAAENPAGRRILVGSGPLAQAAGLAVSQSDLPGTERYRIQTVGNDLILAGNDAGDFRGTTHAVYDLLQRLGCGWFGPDPLYHVIPRRETLSVPPLNVDEAPDFDMRRIGFVRDPVLLDAWRLGGFRVHTSHTLNRLVRDALREEHPDWFGPGQPCLTHPGVQQHIVEQFRQRLDDRPGRFLSLSIGQNDNARFCSCKRCREAGNVSARYLKFANAIADALRETHAGRFQLGFLAYWVTHGPPNPMVEARPEVTVLIVNEGDHTKPLDLPVPPENAKRGRNNLREQNAIEGWLPSNALKGVYEWWIPGCRNPDWRQVPWYSGETALRNQRTWKEHGLRSLTYETGYEEGNGFPLRWPLYYVAARGAWDSTLTSTQIMHGACAKLFGAAAVPMTRYYATLEKAMLETPHPGGNWHLPSAEMIYSPEIEARATDYLDEADAVDALPLEQARIAAERALWNRARATLAKLRAEQEAGGFEVRLEDETRTWGVPEIDVKTLCDIFGLERNAALLAVEGDGQTREVTPADRFDLRTGVIFRSAPKNLEGH